jgi:hypothetical protein
MAGRHGASVRGRSAGGKAGRQNQRGEAGGVSRPLRSLKSIWRHPKAILKRFAPQTGATQDKMPIVRGCRSRPYGKPWEMTGFAMERRRKWEFSLLDKKADATYKTKCGLSSSEVFVRVSIQRFAGALVLHIPLIFSVSRGPWTPDLVYFGKKYHGNRYC